MAEPIYPGYSYAGAEPGTPSAIQAGFTSAISDFARMRERVNMQAYEEAHRQKNMSLSRAAGMAMGFGTYGIPGGQQMGREYLAQTLSPMASTAALYGTGLGLGAAAMYGGAGRGVWAGRAAGAAARGIFGRGMLGTAMGGVAKVSAGFAAWGAPIMAGLHVANRAIDYVADRQVATQDIMSMAGRMNVTGFGTKSSIGQRGAASEAGRYVVDVSRKSQFFGTGDVMNIHKIGLASGLLKGGTATEYKKNFDDLIKSAEDVVKMLNTTIEGGMSVMSSVKKSIGLTKMSDIRQYIGQSVAAGAVSGYGGANMMRFGAMGAAQVRGTGISGMVGAGMMQQSIVRARQNLTFNPQLGQSYIDLGGAAGVGQVTMRATTNVLNAGFGRMALASVYDPSTDTINQRGLTRLMAGKMSAGEIASAGQGWDQYDIANFDLQAPKLINRLGADKARLVTQGVFEAWTRERVGDVTDMRQRRAAASQFSKMFVGTPMGQAMGLGVGAGMADLEVFSNMLAQGPNSASDIYARRVTRKSANLAAIRSRNMAPPGMLDRAKTWWGDVAGKFEGVYSSVADAFTFGGGGTRGFDISNSTAYAQSIGAKQWRKAFGASSAWDKKMIQEVGIVGKNVKSRIGSFISSVRSIDETASNSQKIMGEMFGVPGQALNALSSMSSTELLDALESGRKIKYDVMTSSGGMGLARETRSAKINVKGEAGKRYIGILKTMQRDEEWSNLSAGEALNKVLEVGRWDAPRRGALIDRFNDAARQGKSFVDKDAASVSAEEMWDKFEATYAKKKGYGKKWLGKFKRGLKVGDVEMLKDPKAVKALADIQATAMSYDITGFAPGGDTGYLSTAISSIDFFQRQAGTTRQDVSISGYLKRAGVARKAITSDIAGINQLIGASTAERYLGKDFKVAEGVGGIRGLESHVEKIFNRVTAAGAEGKLGTGDINKIIMQYGVSAELPIGAQKQLGTLARGMLYSGDNITNLMSAKQGAFTKTFARNLEMDHTISDSQRKKIQLALTKEGYKPDMRTQAMMEVTAMETKNQIERDKLKDDWKLGDAEKIKDSDTFLKEIAVNTKVIAAAMSKTPSTPVSMNKRD